MGLLDFLFGGGQNAQAIDPRQLQQQQPGRRIPLPAQQPMQAQTAVDGTPGAGFRAGGSGGLFSGRLSGLNDPTVAMPIAAMLMQPGNVGSNLGQGFALAAPAMQARKQGNATAAWLEAQGADPQLVAMAQGGGGAQALQMYQISKKDPLTQLQLEKGQLEIEALKHPKPTYMSAGDGTFFNPADGSFITAPGGGTLGDFNKRKAIAEQLGMTPEDPAYKSFMATGKMPREDQAPLTATDKKAILEADEMVQTNAQAIEALDSVLAGPKGKTLNDRAGYGFTANAQAWAARNDPTGLFSDATGEATTELNNVVLGQALANLKSTFGAAPTEGERKILIELQASTDKTPVERADIIKRAKRLALNRLEFNKKRADELRGGTFYKTGGGGATINQPAPTGSPGGTSGSLNWTVEQ